MAEHTNSVKSYLDGQFDVRDFCELIVKPFLCTIDINLQDEIQALLNGHGGKRGGLFLQGPPGCGKSLVTKLILGGFEDDEIGIVARCSEDNRFWAQDLIGKEIYVGEEFIVNDINADHLKLLLEGSRLAMCEKRNIGLRRIPRKPFVITSNFNLTVMCPRHYGAMYDRLFAHHVTIKIPDSAAINAVHYFEPIRAKAVFDYLWQRKEEMELCSSIKRKRISDDEVF